MSRQLVRPRLPYSLGVWSLLADQGLMNAGFYMLFPLLTVHLIQDLGFDATGVGLVLAVRQIIQQGGAPLGGALSDRVGYKPVIVAGFVVRTLGFLLFAVSSSLLGVLAGTVVTALGGALFDPPGRASLAYLTPDRDRQSVYAAAGAASWIGQVVGPLLGALLLPYSFTLVSAVAAAAYLLAAAQAVVFVPGGMRGESTQVTLWASIGATLRDADFARFTVLLLGYYFLATQIVITVPLLTNRVAGPAAIGPVFAMQAVLALALQVPLSRWAGRRFNPITQMWSAMLVIALGFAGYALAGDVRGLAAATAVVAVGQLLVAPVQSLVTARLSSGRGGAYFGVSSLALAVGGALGNGTGGALLDAGWAFGIPWLPWYAMATVGLLTAVGYQRLGRDPRLRARLAGRPLPAC